MSTASEKPKIINLNIERIIKGLTGIGAMDIEDFKLNYYITRNVAILSSVDQAYQKSLSALVKKYVKQEPSGNPCIVNNFYEFDNKEKKEAFEKEKETLDEISFDDKIFYLKTSQLKNVRGVGLGKQMAFCHELIEDDSKLD